MRTAVLAPLLVPLLVACMPPEDPDPSFCAVPLGDSPRRGAANAPVVVVEFADFECPYCRRAEPTLAQLLEERPGEVALVFKHAPSGSHAHALAAALAAVCANQQGHFWEMHDALIAPSAALDETALENHALSSGLDVPEWQRCRDSDAAYLTVEQDLRQAIDAGVSGTPTFFINGRALVGAAPLESFLEIVDSASAAAAATGLSAAENYAELETRTCR